MATFQSIFIPASQVANVGTFTATVGAGSTATIAIPFRALFALTVSADSNILFGNATRVPTAAATSLPIWAKTFQEWDMGEEFDRISIFSAAGCTYWITLLSRT